MPNEGHPVRLVLLAAFGVPCALLLGLLIARLAGQESASRNILRIFRYVLALEGILLALLAIGGFVYEQRARRRDAETYHPPGRLIDVGGHRMHISCAGSGGPTVILEYGYQSFYFEWQPVVQPEIAKFARVCFYDRAGYGWSDPSPRPRVPSVMAEELHSLLHAAGEKPPYILVAHSMGSFNAVMFAHKYPDEVAGAVLVDGLHTLTSFPFRLGGRASLRSMQLIIPFGLPRWRGWCGGAAPPELRGEKQALSCRVGLYEAFYREREAFSESAAEIRQIGSLGDLPLIVIARDPALGNVNPDEGDDWQAIQRQKMQLSKNVELMIATGSGHDIPRVRPDVIIAAVKKLAAVAAKK